MAPEWGEWLGKPLLIVTSSLLVIGTCVSLAKAWGLEATSTTWLVMA